MNERDEMRFIELQLNSMEATINEQQHQIDEIHSAVKDIRNQTRALTTGAVLVAVLVIVGAFWN